MKIAIYQPRASYYLGGGEVIPLEQARWLIKNGHEVTLLTTRAKYIKQLDSFRKFINLSGVSVDFIDLPLSFRWIYDMPAGVNWRRWDLESLHVGRLAYSYFLKYKFDLIITHNLFDCIAAPQNQKSVVHLHGTPDVFEEHHYLLSTLPDAYIAVSAEVGSNWGKALGIESKITVIKNGVDISRFYFRETTVEYDFLYVGRLLPVKGIDVILKALNEIKTKRNLQPVLAIAGIGQYVKELENMAKELGVINQVKFLGYIKDDDLAELYSKANTIVLPSKAKEGVLTTMLEAASCARPIIATNVGGIPEFLVNLRNGLLVEPDNYLDLAAAMEKFLTEPALRARLGEGALNDIKAQWRWPDRIKQLEHAYRALIY